MVVLLAYKRYIHKKGKRHGPYYYKNVRDDAGRVRSVYLGKVTSRAKKPLEVAIVFLMLLIIIIASLFFIQNRSLVLSKIAAEESKVPFEIDQILIKVLVKANEYVEKELRVMNVGDGEKNVNIDVSGISGIVNVLEKEFTIKPGQTKIARVNISSFNKAGGIEQSPGVYIGKLIAKSDSYQKEIPVIVEVESKNVLFDMNLNPVARDRSVLQGASTTFEIRVFNLQSIESSNVGMEYFVKDINGNTIISEVESVVVKTQASFFKTLKIPENLKTGNYVFAAKASFGNSVGVASYLFEVEEAAKEKKTAEFIGFCRNDPLCLALSIVVLLLIFTIGAYAYFFIGAFIYKKLFEIRAPKLKKVEEIEAETLIAEEKKESSIAKFLRDWRNRKKRAKERRLEKKLKLKKQKLELREEEKKLKFELEEKERRLKEERRNAEEDKKKKREEEKRKKQLEEEKRKEEEQKKRRLEEERQKEIERRNAEEEEKRQKELKKKESSIAKFLRDWRNRRKRARELRLKRRLEFEKQKLKLQERRERLREQRLREKEKEFEIKKKEEEKKEKEREERKGITGKCRRLIDKGYRALDKNNFRKADNAYAKLMDVYMELPSERKIEVFKEINSFYKSLLLKTSQL